MKNQTILTKGLLHAVIAVVYISFIALIMRNGDRLFGEMGGILSAITFLSLFVTSAAVMGVVVFGKPILWYLDGNKKEAVSLLLYTIGWLIAITGIFITVLAV
ncbi:MAG: hypothetical protein HOJ15_01925 [Candidatus Jacksonbacteria bacterium]|jgi:hypothetical protein|nr:hypothetical protein [Candidatus Jacksonbacteria bacterium]MBT6034692.1 hypothetical protein [Candidatus Jacksonbacteria bacterium]MBT6301165.1 hypothetical protein [Candidatus Jacksonbacteria bacterium]MBT6757265.1 hypothetical protein [Candidatus Jacksonbacteria bacterium]MBT6954773.1 hypothetical protein [Candidatus Jacksonbacteria bacterium]